jgi:hypothetical protein
VPRHPGPAARDPRDQGPGRAAVSAADQNRVKTSCGSRGEQLAAPSGPFATAGG